MYVHIVQVDLTLLLAIFIKRHVAKFLASVSLMGKMFRWFRGQYTVKYLPFARSIITVLCKHLKTCADILSAYILNSLVSHSTTDIHRTITSSPNTIPL